MVTGHSADLLSILKNGLAYRVFMRTLSTMFWFILDKHWISQYDSTRDTDIFPQKLALLVVNRQIVKLTKSYLKQAPLEKLCLSISILLVIFIGSNAN